jgi:hypothetical protein
LDDEGASAASTPIAQVVATPAVACGSAAAAESDDEGEPAPEPVHVEAHHAGGIDRASARRAWPMVIGEIKKQKAARGHLFASTEVDVDSDGETLVVEFPADQSFGLQLAEDPEMRELLQRALATVLGFAPPVRFQLGKGAVRPAQPDAGPPQSAPRSSVPPASPVPERVPRVDAGDDFYDDGPPLDSYGMSAGSVAPEQTAAVAPQSDLERLLTQGLGAQIVSEHAARPDETAADPKDEIADYAGPDSADLGLFDPELSETDSREDD